MQKLFIVSLMLTIVLMITTVVFAIFNIAMGVYICFYAELLFGIITIIIKWKLED